MRKALVTLSILLMACLQVARADIIANAAPADEYFGPSAQSVLEIQNRLNDYDKQDTRDMLDPATTTSLNHLEIAILEWQHKYPRDPWLPRTISHLMREYWRAGQASSDPSMAALAVMRTAYGDSPYTTSTVAMIYGSNGAIADVARDEVPLPPAPIAQVQAVVQEPVVAAVPVPPSANGLPSYAVPGSDAPGYAPQYPQYGDNVPTETLAVPPEPVAQQQSAPQEQAVPQVISDTDSDTAGAPADEAPQNDAAPQADPGQGDAPTPPPAR